MQKLSTIKELLDLAISKCGSQTALSNRARIARSTIWKIRNDKLKGKARDATLLKLTKVVTDL